MHVTSHPERRPPARMTLRLRHAAPLLCTALTACGEYTFVTIDSGFDLLPEARAAIAEDGTVAAARSQAIVVGDGSAAAGAIDLSGGGFTITAASARRPLQIRSEGDIAFVAAHAGVPGCVGDARGAYRTDAGGVAPTILLEHCQADGGAQVGPNIALSPGGTVAVSDIVNGQGALWRGPVAGPLSSLRTGTGEFFNTGGLDVDDNGRVSAQMEYFDGFAGGLMRGVLAFDTPEQAKAEIVTAVEKLGIGAQPPHATNAAGTMALSINSPMSLNIGGTVYDFAAGVYVAHPTAFNSPKDLTLVAGLDGPYCRVGAVDIDDAGAVYFEAQLDAEGHCGSAFWDGIFHGGDPTTDAVVARGAAELGDHQYFDSIRLGEVNGGGQVAFLTTYSEPLVPPFMLWRADPVS